MRTATQSAATQPRAPATRAPARSAQRNNRRSLSCRAADVSTAAPETAPAERPAVSPNRRETADLGTSISQPELRRYLDCYTSSPAERTHEVPAEAITVRSPATF